MGAVGVEGRCCGWHGGAPVRLTKRTGARGGRAVATLAMKIFFPNLASVSWNSFHGQPIFKKHLLDSQFLNSFSQKTTIFFIKSCFCFPTRRF